MDRGVYYSFVLKQTTEFLSEQVFDVVDDKVEAVYC
jgi:hypothetical protein